MSGPDHPDQRRRELPFEALRVCPECDLVLQRPTPRPRELARCPRCRCVLARGRRNPVDRSLALSVAALVCFSVAQTLPVMALSIEGRETHSTIAGGALALAHADMRALALLFFAASVALPLLRLVGLVYVLLPVRLGWCPRHLPGVLRRLQALAPWAMLEVYLLGALVAFVKLGDVAEVEAGIALYAFAALIATSAALSAVFDPHAVWSAREGRG